MLFTARVIEDTEEKQAVLLKNYLEHVHNKFNKYAFCFFFCELLNVTISVSQVAQETIEIIPRLTLDFRFSSLTPS